MNLDIVQLVRLLLALLFASVYAYALIAGVSIFYHFRWFGMRGEIKGKVIEWWFVAINLVIFGTNVALLGSFFLL